MPYDTPSPDLSETVSPSMIQALTGCDQKMAERCAAVIRNYPPHWRDWRPKSPWDGTDLVLLRYAKALERRAA